MRTVESVSRYYARQGYLGLIFSKVTNQLVKICKNHINDDLTQLWPKLFDDIQSGGSIDDIKENFHLDKRVCYQRLNQFILIYFQIGYKTFS
jgi:hypothetical protein